MVARPVVLVTGAARRIGAILRDKALNPESPVGNVLVVGAPHREKGLTPLAFITPAPGQTITRDGTETEVRTRGRHDPCVALRGVPVVEAMAACVLADAMLRHRAQVG